MKKTPNMDEMLYFSKGIRFNAIQSSLDIVLKYYFMWTKCHLRAL